MDQLPAVIPLAEISVLDRTNERSVVNLVPPVVAQAIEDSAFEKGELYEMDERTLFNTLKQANAQPNPTDNRLRLKFWNEYDRVQAKGEKMMVMANVTNGVCSRELFYARYMKSAQKVAWLLCPPSGYMIKAEEALEFGIEQLRDILDQPHVLGGKVDTKLGQLKAKIVLMLDTRVKGAPVQRSMNLHVSTSNESVARAAVASTSEDLMKQLKELEKRNRQAQNLPPADPVEEGGKPDIEIS